MRMSIRRTSALLMAFLMLASTVSWTIEKQYCLDSLVDVAFFKSVDTCCTAKACANDLVATVEKEGSCCTHEIITISGQEDLKTAHQNNDLKSQFFPVINEAYFLTHFLPKAKLHKLPIAYPPPILVRNVQIMEQIFLI